MDIRNFDVEKDYPVVANWWTKQGWPPIPKSILQCQGFMVEEDGVSLAATWIFRTGCPVYIMEWTVGNPEVKWEKRSEALQQVTEGACKWAKQDGAAQVFTMTKHDKFIKKLQDNMFTLTDSGMTHLVRNL